MASESEPICLHYEVPGNDFTRAGEASADLKARLKALGFPSAAVRRAAIALYEGEINLAIHAHGGHILSYGGFYYWYGEDRRDDIYVSV